MPELRGPRRAGPAWADAGVGLFVLALAGLGVAGTLSIPPSPLYARVGPTLFPWITAGGLALLGVGLTAAGLRGGWSHGLEDRPTDPPNPRAFGLILAGLLANVLLIDALGFVLASTLQFVLICACFSSVAYVRNAMVALEVCAGSYVVFSYALGVNIGTGILEPWLDVGVGRLAGLFGLAS